MATVETKRQSDLEKRLKLLRQQVYGRQEFKVQSLSRVQSTNYQLPTTNFSDITYLYQDLAKIGILASLAIGLQLILFILSKNHILNLNFF